MFTGIFVIFLDNP